MTFLCEAHIYTAVTGIKLLCQGQLGHPKRSQTLSLALVSIRQSLLLSSECFAYPEKSPRSEQSHKKRRLSMKIGIWHCRASRMLSIAYGILLGVIFEMSEEDQ